MKSNSITTISEGVKIKRSIYTSGVVKINGEVIGDIESENEISIGENGRVEANIKAKDATIAGYFKGEMKASGHVSITSTGGFEGNLIQENALFSISKGGLFKGKSIFTDKKDMLELEDNSKISYFEKSKREKVAGKEVKVAV